MCPFIKGKDHLAIHVLEIRPYSIEGQIVLVEFIDDVGNLRQLSITPPTLVVSEAPKRRDMTRSDVLVEFLKKNLRVLEPENDDKMNVAT
jgi:hypothetical protein